MSDVRLKMYLTRNGVRNRRRPLALDYGVAEAHLHTAADHSVHLEDPLHGEASVQHDPGRIDRYQVRDLWAEDREPIPDLTWETAIRRAHTLVVRTYA